MALAIFMTHASTCRVGRGKRGWKTDEKTRQVREEGWGDYKVDAGRQTNTKRYDAARHILLVSKAKDRRWTSTEMLCTSFALAQKNAIVFLLLLATLWTFSHLHAIP